MPAKSNKSSNRVGPAVAVHSFWALRAITLAANLPDKSATVYEVTTEPLKFTSAGNEENRLRTQGRRKSARRSSFAVVDGSVRDHIVLPLRLAAGVATSAVSQGTSGQKTLNKVRVHATEALNAVIRALQTRTLTHKIITSAKEAVDEWLAGLDAV